MSDQSQGQHQPSPEEKAFEGLTHLQTAAAEMISAARAFLDVAEGLMKDPRTAAAVTTAIQTVTEAASGVLRPPTPRSASGAEPGDPPADGRVEHIHVD